MPDVTMPRLSDSMEEGTILKWLKSDGDEVKRGEELAEIETDKATLTYEADADGVLEIVAKEGDTLPIGEVIAKLGDGSGGGGDDASGDQDEDEDETDEDGQEEQPGGEEKPDDESGEDEDAKGDEDEPEGNDAKDEGDGDGAKAEPQERKADSGGDDGRVKASPVARRLAEEHGVDLATLEGSGPGGRIVKADVEQAASGEGSAAEEEEKAPEKDEQPAEAKEQDDEQEEASVGAASSAKQQARSEPEVAERGTAKGDVRVEELTRIQQVVARRMAEAKATIPEFTLTTEVDMERAVGLRDQFKQVAGEDGVVPSYNDMVVKAAAMALRAFPRANGAYRDNRFELYSRVNIGVAVAAQDSLVVPTVFDADQKSMGEIARDMRKLAARVRDGTVTPPEMSGGTFTVSNLGMYGVTEFTAVINPPQAAILAVGALRQEPRVIDGRIVPRHVMNITIVSDHRILYGADAAQFLAKVRELLEEPLGLAL